MRPERIVLVCGTGTEVGKTWVGSRLLRELRPRGCRWPPASRPSRSTSTRRDTGWGEPPMPRCWGRPRARTRTRCATRSAPTTGPWPPRWRPRPWAFPASAIGRPDRGAGLAAGTGCRWVWWRRPVGCGPRRRRTATPPTCSSQLAPDAVVLVSDAGLGTINGVRMSMDALATVTGAMPAVPDGGGPRPVRRPPRHPPAQPRPGWPIGSATGW